MVQKSVIISEAESCGASDEFIKFLEAGYEKRDDSIVYSKIVRAVDNGELEACKNSGGDFMRSLWKGDTSLRRLYNIADTTNQEILEQAYPEKLG